MQKKRNSNDLFFRILKSGVGIVNDAKLLGVQYGLITQGCVDLQPIAHKCGRIEGGTKNVARIFFN